MLSGIGVPGIILLVILALLLFGAHQVPWGGGGVGRTVRGVKDGGRGIVGEGDQAARKSEAKPLAASETQQPAPVQSSAAQDKRLPE